MFESSLLRAGRVELFFKSWRAMNSGSGDLAGVAIGRELQPVTKCQHFHTAFAIPYIR